MVNFLVYDLIFLVAFTTWLIWFIRTRKKGVSVEGRLFGIPMIFMYRTQAGVKAIKWVGDNCAKFLRPLKWVIITMGYFLMAFIVWMLIRVFRIYLIQPEIVEYVKAPPVAPLIPYFPRIFGMESFFPDFYFTYFLVALAIVAIVHEFSHGIFMRLFKVKIKSTGFVFFGPFLGAFVEENHKTFEKRPKTEQMTILGAGVFANVLTALVFFGIWLLMFSTLFAPAGYQFNTYASGSAPANLIDSIGEDLGEFTIPMGGVSMTKNLSQVDINGSSFLIYTDVKELLQENETVRNSSASIPVFYDAPAIRSQMVGRIVEADGEEITGQESLRIYLQSKQPGENATFVLEQDEGQFETYEVELGVSPSNESMPYIGIAYYSGDSGSGIFSVVNNFIRNPSSTFDDPATYYEPIFAKDLVNFVYLLVWWIILINFLVAVFNMVPASIFDGGRFFYLTILGITRSEKIAKKAFKFSSYLLLFWAVALMSVWLIRIV